MVAEKTPDYEYSRISFEVILLLQFLDQWYLVLQCCIWFLSHGVSLQSYQV